MGKEQLKRYSFKKYSFGFSEKFPEYVGRGRNPLKIVLVSQRAPIKKARVGHSNK